MARPVVLSNGEMHVGLNKYGLVHDFYYPYVGLENHSADRSLRHHIGVYVDGQIHWLDDDTWDISQTYPHDALIGHTVARNHKIGIIIEFDDAVDSDMSAFLRTIHVINNSKYPREVKLYMHQAFIIGDSRSYTDTAQYLPDNHAVLHYRGRRAFMISGISDGEPFDQYTIGLFGIERREGTFRDAEDGQLSGNNVEHGQVDSTIGFTMALDAHSSKRVDYWVAAGTSTREALYVHKTIVSHGVAERQEHTARWWNDWTKPATKAAEKLEPKYRKVFLDSAMIIKSHIDKRGAVMASTDSSLLKQMRDAYAYCWPRDGAYAIWPLMRMGYVDEPHRFFDFCRRSLHPSGYLMHKYRADGALGSSWHPYVHDNGQVSPPIQEDETALVLFVFAQFYQMQQSAKLLQEFYEPFVLPMADFIANHIDHRTSLPKPSYDLWEENFMTSTYTTCVVNAALLAAADLAEAYGDNNNAVSWRAVADDIAIAARKHFYRPAEKTFYKGLLTKPDGSIEYLSPIDASSTYGAFMYGLFASDSQEVSEAVETLVNRLQVDKALPGIARYENDNYLRFDNTTNGNRWVITSLWLAQYYIERDCHVEARQIIDWAISSSLSTGVLSEQVSPHSDEQISVTPLVWSHAELVSTLLDSITEKH